MGDSDPYRPPDAELKAPVQVDSHGQVLASRESRLAAAMIDGATILVIMGPLQWKAGMFENPASNSFVSTLTWFGAGLAITLLIQGYTLAKRAQSLGKIAMRIKIVTLDGQNADFKRIVLWRMLPIYAVSMVPFVGALLSTLDSLLIFREDQRCIHDHIAGTRVVRV